MGRPSSRACLSLSAALVLIAACVTVNIYFPAAQVEKTAEKIVGEIYQEKNEAPVPEKSEKPQSREERGTIDAGTWLAWLGPSQAHAQEATTVSNAAIRALKEQIGQRHQELLSYYQQGQVGIDKDGYLAARDTAGLGLPQVAALKRLVEADNSARRQLYEEVAKALNLTSTQVPQVQQIFARQWREKAQAGWWVQSDDGKWARK